MTDPNRDEQITYLSPVLSRPDIRTYLRELWDIREFIFAVPRNNLRAQNMDTVLGNFWFLLNPALLTLIYFFIFGILFKANRGVTNYIGYLVIGILIFSLIGQSTTSASRCVASNQSLIRSLYFPRAAIPLSSAIASIYVFLPGAAIMLVVAVAGGSPPTVRWLTLPGILCITTMFVLGMVFFVARLGRSFRDLPSLLPHLIRLLLYSSGAMFDPATLTQDKTILLMFDLNPFYQLLTMWRWAILGREMSGFMWASITTWAVVALILGFIYFWKAETSYGAER